MRALTIEEVDVDPTGDGHLAAQPRPAARVAWLDRNVVAGLRLGQEYMQTRAKLDALDDSPPGGVIDDGTLPDRERPFVPRVAQEPFDVGHDEFSPDFPMPA